ncbi:hypothetical protein AB0M10_15110 [Streptomyces sp. NPDC051840]|uniref:hypothetical protein n=1 Tax=Streptomyces sp. NPDC051840 TaxID=3154752 RepID=UPI00341C06D9
MDDAQVIPTDDEVDDFMQSIPTKLRKCAAAQHAWSMQSWTAFSRTGKALKRNADPHTAAFFEATEVCGGQAGCGYKRHYEMAWRGSKLKRTTEYSYSERNPLLVSPRGISRTSIVVRTEVADLNRSNHILGNVVHLAPAGNTKKALNRKGAA